VRSVFSGLDIAYRALQAQQTAIDVINHNIANANTPGYSRQVAILGTTTPYTIPAMSREVSAGQLGTGVTVTAVQRTRYAFLDYQIRNENQTLGQWQAVSDALGQVEVVLNEPSNSGLNSSLSKFWAAWQDLTNDPQDAGGRGALVEQSDTLAGAIKGRYSQLVSIRKDLDDQIKVQLENVNNLADQVASLNVKIAQVELVGQNANDLRDQRDQVLDELSQVAKVSYSETTDGAVNVFVGSRALVQRNMAEHLTTSMNAEGYSDVVWADNLSAASITDGKIYGLMQARDVELPRFIGDLNNLASQIITQVNNLHRAGFGLDNSTGINFFTGTSAADMAVNGVLKTNPQAIAASAAANSPGDNSVALSIARLESALTMNGGTATFAAFYASSVSRLGVNAKKAEIMSTNQQSLVDHLTKERDSQSGVSLDEETVHLIEYQRAYQAAARVVTTVDEMLNTIINGMGLVGRS
jgi:flagellar hook-associated protein 1